MEKSKASTATKRTHLTTFISKTLKSRQKEIPLVGKFIDCAKTEPLHIKNNTTKELFLKLLRIVMASPCIKNCRSYPEVQRDSLFAKLMDFLRYNMGCNFLSKKIITWFNENNGKHDKEFTFRFRGKESFAYIKHFSKLIKMLLSNITSEESKVKLHQLFYCSLLHRKIIGYSVRIDGFDGEMQKELEISAQSLFKACCLFYPRLSVSMWVLTNVLPAHSSHTLQKYNFGIGCNTMEAREQKHQQIQKYSHNTTFQNRWQQIFRHEFIQLVYLREHGYDTLRYRKRKVNYLPKYSEQECQNCGIELDERKCLVCDSKIMFDLKKRMSKY